MHSSSSCHAVVTLVQPYAPLYILTDAIIIPQASKLGQRVQWSCGKVQSASLGDEATQAPPALHPFRPSILCSCLRTASSEKKHINHFKLLVLARFARDRNNLAGITIMTMIHDTVYDGDATLLSIWVKYHPAK